MARGKNTNDLETLKMALVGYQAERQKIDDKISQIEGVLKGKQIADGTAPSGKAGRKRVLSAAARNRIAAAQKKRWAEHRKRMAQGKSA